VIAAGSALETFCQIDIFARRLVDTGGQARIVQRQLVALEQQELGDPGVTIALQLVRFGPAENGHADPQCFGVTPRLARQRLQPGDTGRRLGDGQVEREPAVARPCDPLLRYLRIAADHDRDAAGADGPGIHIGVAKLDGRAVELGGVRAPQRAHGVDIFVHPLAARLPVGADGVHLLLAPADARTQSDPAATELVEDGQLLGQHDGIALRQDQDRAANLQRRRGGSRPGHGHDRLVEGQARVGDRRIAPLRIHPGIGVRRFRIGAEQDEMVTDPEGGKAAPFRRLRRPANEIPRRTGADARRANAYLHRCTPLSLAD